MILRNGMTEDYKSTSGKRNEMTEAKVVMLKENEHMQAYQRMQRRRKKKAREEGKEERQKKRNLWHLMSGSEGKKKKKQKG